MAQVLLDQRKNRRILKKSLMEDKMNIDDNSYVSSRLRQRNITANCIDPTVNSLKGKQHPVLAFPEKVSIDFVEQDDSGSCDDPGIAETDTEDSPSADAEEIQYKKSKGFSCSVCGQVASSSQRLKEHLSRHTGVKHLECEICGKKFAWRYSFRSHMASHMEDNPNKCTICGKKYCNKSSVKNHMLRIHGNPNKDFACEKCGKKFMTKTELDRHSFNHSKEKPFVCEFCGNTYRFKGALSVHYRVHSGEKPYKCGFCDKAFIHLSSAIGHRRRHTGEMPFQCNQCGKLFRVKRAMTAHMSVHSEKRPFQCEECGKAFKSRSGYRVHLDFHLGVKRHSCKYCGRTFRAWCNMHKHMRRHVGEKPHKCESCGKTFIEKQELKNHMKCHHENNKRSKKPTRNRDVVATCTQIVQQPTLTCSPNMDAPPEFNGNQHTDQIMSSHIDISDNQAVIYDCSLNSSLDKCQTEKCQLLQDSYVSHFLYPQHSSVQYAPQPVMNMYPATDPGQTPNRSCLSGMISNNFNCVSLNNQNYNNFSYNLPNSDGLLSKCKLCRSLFHSTIFLRNHLLEYHRIEEENIDELIT